MIPQNSPGVCLILHLSSWLETNLVYLFIFPADHEPFKAGCVCFHYTIHPGTELGTQQAFSFNKHTQLHWIIYYVKVINLKHMKWILSIKSHMWSTKYKWKEVKLKMIMGGKKKLLKKRIRKKKHENQYTVFRKRGFLDISGSLIQDFRIFKNIQSTKTIIFLDSSWWIYCNVLIWKTEALKIQSW